MKESFIRKRLGSLEDVEFQGLSWEGNDLRLVLDGHDYSSLICAWAYDLRINLTWESETAKVSGPILSTKGAVDEVVDDQIRIHVEFGSRGFISVRCGDIEVVD